ncbi:MAG: hypothetical protein RLZZ84_1700 [Pseudomonadota bacterium]
MPVKLRQVPQTLTVGLGINPRVGAAERFIISG